MFTLGLLLPNVFVPGYTGAAIPSQWALLSLAFIVLLRGPWPKFTALHYLGLLFISFACLSILWCPVQYDTAYGIWMVVIWALSFQLGFMTFDTAPLCKGLSIGLIANTAVAISQWLGYAPLETFRPGNVAGLLYNPTMLAATCALTAILCFELRLLWYTITPIFCLLLTGSRGGLLIVAITLANRIHWSFAPLLAAAAAVVFTYNHNSSDLQRLEVWGVAAHMLCWLGWGANSFSDLFYISSIGLAHPEFVHNDYIQLVFEYGVFAIVPFAIFALSYIWRPSAMALALAILAGFYFPLYAPITAFLACFWVGHSLRGFSVDGFIIHRCRFDFLSWRDNKEPSFDEPRGEDIPVPS